MGSPSTRSARLSSNRHYNVDSARSATVGPAGFFADCANPSDEGSEGHHLAERFQQRKRLRRRCWRRRPHRSHREKQQRRTRVLRDLRVTRRVAFSKLWD
jgi:hypothetical protein